MLTLGALLSAGAVTTVMLTAPTVSAQQPAAAAASKAEAGFKPLFDGTTLTGWQIVNQRGEGYGVKDGVIFCAKGGGGKLLTDKEYGDFVLRFEFKMPEEGSNNGLGIRAPLEGDAAYQGIELQILDEKAALAGKWGQLRDAQYHGSVYDVFAAKKGAMKPAGEWNQQEVTAKGRHITVKLNGQVITDVNLDTVTDPEVLKKHPGLARTSGYIGFLGHNDYIEFRNIRIKPL
jgi:3-keto-disaccharide hydrolase